MHFSKSTPSQQKMVEEIEAANDICTLYGVCDYLGDNQEDLEGPPSIVLTPMDPTSATSSHSMRDDFSCSAFGGDSVHRVVTFSGRFSHCEQERGTQAASSASKSKAVSASSKELVQLCTFASYAESLKAGQFLHTRRSRESLKKVTIAC